MNKKCLGCGAPIQNTNPEDLGYTPKDITEAKYCERCYKIIHYNQKTVTNLPNINNYILKTINKKAKYVYFLIDFLNLNEETINTFQSIKVPKTLIISKLDIIPKSIKKEKIITWLNKTYQIKDNIIFQSTKKNLYTKYLINNLESSNIKECYIVGYTNAGKSSLINKLCSLYNNDNILTTSEVPNTTIDFINIKLSDNITIIDSPGFTYNNYLFRNDDFTLINKINPKKFIKPITYQTVNNTSLLIENLIRITPNNKNSLTLYLNNNLNISRVFDHAKELNYPNITLNVADDSDLVIKSLGFINIKKACQLNIQISNKSLIEIRPSLFNKERS